MHYPSMGLLETIQHCAVTCEHMTSMLHKKGMLEARGEQLAHLRDCADICQLMVDYLARGSVFSKSLASICAYICEICGNTCMQFPDEASQKCARTCLNCAKACKEFAEY
ncbi:four-helix bundle copper-binding protein [Radiobacillus deserti]|uniref:Four-helix bundle copper-binding protein n=2 Tax=Radiobacillus deserti TaxID=2594883 RepID=A0A516KLC5_9BACI|nr:four-helix bundle copper-binding protein [Radiobacillus deserti]